MHTHPQLERLDQIARPWREDAALAAASALECELGGWQPPAGM